ncbi:hypothetical protein F4802DRAFT_121000 [Xylaria palmicola]|nr:hypothetical protein F4802DRAFT_121000 [Xylaria palmicola]
MICYTSYTLLAIGLMSRALAEPFQEPYQPSLARMSTRNILALYPRAVEGYSPTEQLCGAGDTCAEACGKGSKQCTSKDGVTHCFNPSKKETCCPGGRGDSCDNGYFCTADEGGETWCCPDGLSLKECAQKYGIPGSLTSEAPPSPTTSTKKPASEATSTSTESSKSSKTETTTSKTKSAAVSKPEETNTVTPLASTTTRLADVTSALVSTDAVPTQNTALDAAPSSTLPVSSTSPSPATTGGIGESGSSSQGPANGLLFVIAGGLAAFAV